MKKALVIIILLASCSTRQDFENDLLVPEIMKEYHKDQKIK